MCNPLEEIQKAAERVLNKTSETVTSILQNPLPAITMIAATYALGPAGAGLVSASVAPVLAAGTITAIKGGNIGQVAQSALLAYGGGKFAEYTGLGGLTSEIGKNLGGVTGSTVAAGLNNAMFNSTVALLGGKDVGQAFGSGFIGGAAGSLAGAAANTEVGKSFFGTVKDSFGLSDSQMKYIQGAATTMGTAALSGQNPQLALTNYIAQNIADIGKKELGNQFTAAKDKFLTSNQKLQEELEDKEDILDQREMVANEQKTNIRKYKSVEARISSGAYKYWTKDLKKESDFINNNRGEYDAAMAEFEKNKTQENADRVNAAAEKLLPHIQMSGNLSSIINNIHEEINAAGKKVTQFAEKLKELDAQLEPLNKLAEEAKADEKEFTSLGKKVGDELVKDATMDVLSDQFKKESGRAPTEKELADLYKVVGQDKDVSQTISEANKYLDSKFVSESEVTNVFKKNLGRDPTAEELAKFVGGANEATQLKAVSAYIDPLYTDESEVKSQFKTVYGRDPNADELKDLQKFVGAKDEKSSMSELISYIDPKYLDKQEVTDAFKNTLGRAPTASELKKFVGEGDEAGKLDSLNKYLDPLYTDKDEASALFKEILGRDPTEKELEQFVIAGSESKNIANIQKYIKAEQLAEQNRQAEIARQEELRRAQELEAQQKADADRIAEERRIAEEENIRRIEEERKAEEARIAAQAEADRQAELVRLQKDEKEKAKAEELRRIAQEEADRQAEIVKQAEATKQAEEARRAEEERLKTEIKPDVVKELEDAGLTEPVEPAVKPELPPEKPIETELPVKPETPIEKIPGEDGSNLIVDPNTGEVTVSEPVKEETTAETVEPEKTPVKPETPAEPDITKILEDAGLQPPGAKYDVNDTDIGSEVGSETVTTSPGEEPLADLSKSGVIMPDGSFKTWAELDELAGVPPGTIYTDGGTTITEQELQDILNGTYTPKGTTPKPTTPTTPKPTTPTTPTPTTPKPTTPAPTTPVAQQQLNPLGMLALLDVLGQQPQQQPAMQDPYAKIKSFQGDLFGEDISTDFLSAATGGSVDDLLRLLRS